MFKTSNLPLGVDISDLSIRAVQLYKRGKSRKILGLGSIKLKPGIIEDGNIKNFDTVIKSLKSLLSKPQFGSFKTVNAVACLPDTKTFIKVITVDKSPNKIEDTIDSEIEKNIPITIKDMYYDWQTISEGNYSYQILIGAAPKYTVNEYIQLLKGAGLQISALEIESVSICRALLREEVEKVPINLKKNYAIIDIGAKRTSLTVYSKDTIVLSISMPISGNEITNKIAQALQINREQAEKSKIICGLDKRRAQGIISNILSDTIKNLNTKIANAINYYSEHYSRYGAIDEILLCGGGANIKNLDTIINQTTSIPTKLANPFTNLSVLDENIISKLTETHEMKSDSQNKNQQTYEIKQDSSLSYTTAIGLALRNLVLD